MPSPSYWHEWDTYIVTGNNSDVVIDSGYEDDYDRYLGYDYDNEGLYILIVPTLYEESAIRMAADEDGVDHIPKNPQKWDRSHGCALCTATHI